MPVTARQERPPKPLGSICGAGEGRKGGLGGSALRGARTGHAGPRWRTGGPRPRWDHVGAEMGISGLGWGGQAWGGGLEQDTKKK